MWSDTPSTFTPCPSCGKEINPTAARRCPYCAEPTMAGDGAGALPDPDRLNAPHRRPQWETWKVLVKWVVFAAALIAVATIAMIVYLVGGNDLAVFVAVIGLYGLGSIFLLLLVGTPVFLIFWGFFRLIRPKRPSRFNGPRRSVVGLTSKPG